MTKKTVPKPRCSGTWTEAQFITFVKNQLRGASWKWKPISETLAAARVSKGIYKCGGCLKDVPVTVVVNGKRKKNVSVDHIVPIISPSTGFSGWDGFINNLFCERDNLQVLCGSCHDSKTTEEQSVAVARRRKEKEENE